MYLREMGSVELLSREGEIAIAKRIEAGREMMIGGLCESPLTMRALIAWRDALNEGKMLLRDIIDLDATYGSNVRRAKPPRPKPADDEAGKAPEKEAEPRARRARSPPKARPRPKARARARKARSRSPRWKRELKPGVLGNFDEIAGLYKKLHKMQDSRLAVARQGRRARQADREAATTSSRPRWSRR